MLISSLPFHTRNRTMLTEESWIVFTAQLHTTMQHSHYWHTQYSYVNKAHAQQWCSVKQSIIHTIAVNYCTFVIDINYGNCGPMQMGLRTVENIARPLVNKVTILFTLRFNKNRETPEHSLHLMSLCAYGMILKWGLPISKHLWVVKKKKSA